MLSRMSNGAAKSERRGCASSAVARLAAGCGLRGRVGGRALGLPAPSARAPLGSIHPPQPNHRLARQGSSPPLRQLRPRATRYKLRTRNNLKHTIDDTFLNACSTLNQINPDFVKFRQYFFKVNRIFLFCIRLSALILLSSLLYYKLSYTLQVLFVIKVEIM